MKTGWKVILVSLAAAIMLLAAQSPCRGAEKDDANNVWVEDGPAEPNRPLELTDEKVVQSMEWLEENNPQQAQKLTQLRKDDPEKFKQELRETIREQFGKKIREHAGQKPPRESQMGQEKGMWMREREADHLKWLEKNYPDDARKLGELKKKNPELYFKQLMHSMRSYGKIEEAEKDNPQLAEVLKSDLQLRKEQDKLLGKIKDAATEKEKKQLSGELEKVVSSRFDFVVKRKQIEYEMLLKRLEKLKEDVKKSESTVEKWKDQKFKKDAVKSRVGELLSQSEKFQWD
ncbi:MAG: hypothetical protein NTW55_07595 [Planctomycetota bacterium]|nr:hypothetical protein [Planctomycetota bacterium]